MLDPADNLTVLHAFQSQSDGADPRSELIQDTAGNFYGTTISGDSPAEDGGIAFKLDSQGNETVFYNFSFPMGIEPSGLVMDSAGNFYGTTYGGGSPACGGGCGVVFKLDISGNETVLYGFTGGTDGWGFPCGFGDGRGREPVRHCHVWRHGQQRLPIGLRSGLQDNAVTVWRGDRWPNRNK
jgi:uncharacterized repeat protein (TIGR03803 family)